MTKEHENIFKILRIEEWNSFQNEGEFWGSEHDKRDGFIHLSTSSQVDAVLGRYFENIRPIVIIELSIEAVRDGLAWETAKSGDIYPHIYNHPLKMDDVVSVKELTI